MRFDESILELSHEEKLKLIAKFYDEMSEEEFKARLIKAGLEIVEGIKGQVFVEEEIFTVLGEMKQPNYKYCMSNNKPFDAKFLLGVA